MIESGLNKEICWSMESSVIRKEMRKPLYEKLRKAGCNFITYGVETPAEHLLEKVGKTLALKKGVDLPAILREGKEAGIDITINIMIGLPGETEEDFQFLMKFLKENKKSLVQVNPAIQFCEYYPGSSGNADPEKIGIDMSKGTLMWESKDGTNTYLTRMDRFEKVGRILITEGEETDEPTNIHTDPEKAKAMGLERPIASGQMSYSYIHEMLCREFGIDFRQGGNLSVTFLKPVYAGDTVTTNGIVEDSQDVDGRRTLSINVWLENQDGNKTSTGSANVTIPSPRT